MIEMQVHLFASTDKGQIRLHNEDFFHCVIPTDTLPNQQIQVNEKGILLIVADGMGGTNAGEIAAQIAVETIQQQFSQMPNRLETEQDRTYFLQTLLIDAHKAIVRHGKRHPDCANMGTTAIVAWLVNDKAWVAWCGDSRCYVFRQGQPFSPLTNDHSVVWAEVLKGNLTAEQARLHQNSHILLQSLGNAASTPRPDCIVYPLHNGDRLLLCSDGLNSMLSDEQLEQILLENTTSNPANLNTALINAANKAGGRDNITVITADIQLILKKKKRFALIPSPIMLLFGFIIACLGIWFYPNWISWILPQPVDSSRVTVKDMGMIDYTKIKEIKLPPTDTQANILKRNKDAITQIVELRLESFGHKVSDLYKKHYNNRIYIKANHINQNMRKTIQTTFKGYGYIIANDGQIRYEGKRSITPIPDYEFERLRQLIETSKQEINKLLTF